LEKNSHKFVEIRACVTMDGNHFKLGLWKWL